MQYLPGRLIKGMTGKLLSDDTARLSRGVAVSSSHLSSSSFLWSFTHFIIGDPDLKIWSFGAFFISQTNKSGIKRTRKQHGHKSSYWSLTFRWIQSSCGKNYCDKVNRCLARYSPCATTTNQSTNRAPNEPAQNEQKCQFWAKNPNFSWRNQKFFYPHNGKPT